MKPILSTQGQKNGFSVPLRALPARSGTGIPFRLLPALIFALGLQISFAQLTFDPANPPTSDNPPTGEYWHYSGTWSHQKGAKALVVIRVAASDVPWTNPPAESTYTTSLTNLSKRYYDSSGHQTWVGPKKLGTSSSPGHSLPGILVTPVVTLPKEKAYYLNDGGSELFWQLRTDAIAAVRALGGEYASGSRLDPDNFDRIMVVSNSKMISSTGLAYVGGDFSWPGGAYEHELGHNWGLNHANFWKRPAGSILPRDSDGSSVEYGDGADVMGSGSTLFHPLFKHSSLGWLEDSRGEAPTITTSNTYRLYAHNQGFVRNETNKVRALLINTTSGGSTLTLGFRYEPVGSTDGGDSRASRDRNAVQVHWGVSGDNFIDTTPDSRLDDDKIDGSIKIGRTYSEPATSQDITHVHGGLHITPITRGSTSAGNVPTGDHQYIDVVINRGADVPSNNAAPTASFAASTVNATAGSPSSLSITASDPDGDALAYDWDFGNGGYNITNNATQSPTYAAAGLYRVRCTVSDMKGQTTTAYQWVNVGGQSTYAASTDPTTTGLNYRTYSGTFTTMPDFDTLNPVATGTTTGFDLSIKPSNDNFAVLYTGFIEVPATDIYQFEVVADDGAILKIDGQTVVDNNGEKKPVAGIPSSARSKLGNISLAVGKHPFRLEYFHKDGDEFLAVKWWRLGQGDSASAIPTASLVQPTWADNAAPSVSITAPAAGSEVLVNSDVTLTADASDDGSIAKVVFFANGSYLAADTTAPYSYTWPKVSVGAKSLTAIAYDAAGRWTRSAAVAFTVVSPPPANGIGINLGAQTAKPETTLYANERAGAVYDYANWNNITGVTSNTTYTLTDHNGNTLGTTLTLASDGTRSGLKETAADTSTASGKLLRGAIGRDYDIEPSPRPNPWVEVTNIPYAAYDVYVYVDVPGKVTPSSSTNALSPQRLALTPGEGSAPAARFLVDSTSSTGGTGDYSTYDNWSGFREATATALTDSADKLQGNYVVFRNQSASSFLVESTRRDPNSTTRHFRYLTAIQIMEIEPTAPTLSFRHTGGNSSVSESGSTDIVTVALAFAPTGNVTVTLDPGTQLALDQTTLTFTTSNWNQPQAVTVRAVDDSTAEGPHTATLTATATGSNYTDLPARSLPVSIADNDQPAVAVYAIGTPVEGDTPTAATFRFLRSGQSSLASAVTANFTLTGTADKAADFTLSGASVNYDSSSGNGSVVIPAGAASVDLTLTPTNDSTAESSETVILTLNATSGVAAGTPSSAAMGIQDDDRTDYFAQYFASNNAYGLAEYPIDLVGKTLTFTPNGSASHYSASLTSNVTAYPTADYTGHTRLRNIGNSTTGTSWGGNATLEGTLDNGWWTVNNTPAKFYGGNYTTLYVSTEGGVTFDTGSSISNVDNYSHFRYKRVALFWYYLGIGPDADNSGEIYVGRVTTPGQERTVVTYHDVPYAYQAGYTGHARLRGQIEFWDNGKITLTWLQAATTMQAMVGLSRYALPYDNDTGHYGPPSDYQQSNLSEYTSSPGGQAPVFASIPPVTATNGSAYSYAITATDPNGDALTLTAPTKPSWLTFTAGANGTATLSGTPSAAGSHTITLRASDGTLATDQTYTLTVAPAGANTAPAFTGSAPTTANEGLAYSYSVTAADAESQPITFFASTLPGWLTLTDNGNGTATLSGTVPSADLATHRVVLLASDGIAAATQSFTITVNKAPELALETPSSGAAVLSNLSNSLALSATASDDDLPSSPGTLTTAWTKVSGPGTVTFGNSTATSTSATFSAAGIYRLRLTVGDGALSTSADVVAYVETDATAALADGLLGYWKFNEASGTTAADSSGTGNDLTLAGAVTFGSGVEGNAYTGSATDTQYGEKAGLAQPSQMTFSAWVYCSASPSDSTSPRHLLTFRGGTNTRGYLALPNASRQLQFRSSHSTQGVWNVTGYDVPANEWFHITLGYDQSSTANNPVAYINGQSVAVTRATAPSGSINTTDATRIGGSGGAANQAWKGRMDEARLYNRLVTADEAALLTLSSTPNSAPVVTAALRDPLLTGQNSAVLIGTATDDGLPADPGALTTAWVQVSGPATATLASPSELQTDVTFPASGTYVFSLTASDGDLATTATLTAEAQLDAAVATSLNVTPATATVVPSATRQFSASVLDQYNQPMTGQTINWSVSGGGSIDANGLFTADASEGGPFTVTATSGSLSDTADVTVFNNPPTISDIADQVVTQNVATGSLAFTIGDTETAVASLTITATSSNQTLVPDANITLGGSDANRTVQVTPANNQSGSATIIVTVSDGAKSASDTFLLTVQAGVVTSIEVTPATATVQPNGTFQFSATVKDQNGAAMNPQPTVAWSATGAGTINSSGLFTASSSNGSATVTATVNSVSGNATVTVTNTAPTVTITSPTLAAFAMPDATNSLQLTANATDSEVTPTVTWSKVSGPGTATFANASSANTSVSFGATGEYVLRVTASDGLLTATDDVTVNVGSSGGLGPVSAYLSANFLSGVTNGSTDSLLFSGDSANKAIAFTGGGNNAASPMWTVADSAKVDFKQINSVTYNGFTWGQSSDPIRYGSVFTTGTDFGYVIGASNSNIRYTGTGATQPLVQFGAGAPASGAFNLVFEVKGTEPLGNLTVKYKAGTASTGGVWNGGATAAENGNYNVSVHPLDASGNAGTGFTFYASNQSLGAGAGVSVAAADQGSNSLAPGTYLLRILFFDKTKAERYSIDDVSIEGSTGLPAGPQVNPGSAPAAESGVAATLTGTANANATWSLVSGPGTATFANANAAATDVTFGTAGTYILRLSATDATATVFEDLSVTVTSSNTAPTIGTVNAQTLPANGTTGALAFTIGDTQTAAADLTLTATSSNQTLVPDANLTLGGSDANRTITVLPASNRTGNATITLTVSDGTLTANTTFTVTVSETPASWISGYPEVGDLTAATDDPDADGLPNLVEYALGGDPSDQSYPSDHPAVGVSAESHLTLTFTPQRVDGLTYIIEASSDLSDWSDTSDITSQLTPGTPHTHTDSSAVTTRRFLRLKVSAP
jgi:hypothetical protein